METVKSSRPAEDEVLLDRRARILDAAERCFVRAGFHRTTMQDVAAEAGMSPGNLYRYFSAKDMIVAALAERDRAELGRDFAKLAEAEDFLAELKRLARKHFAEEPREKSILCLEIWAEATRNPAFVSIAVDFERDVVGQLTTLFGKAQGEGAIAPQADPGALAVMLATLADGLFVRRAILPGFDAEREVGNVMAVIEAACAGRIDLPGSGASGAGGGGLS